MDIRVKLIYCLMFDNNEFYWPDDVCYYYQDLIEEEDIDVSFGCNDADDRVIDVVMEKLNNGC